MQVGNVRGLQIRTRKGNIGIWSELRVNYRKMKI